MSAIAPHPVLPRTTVGRRRNLPVGRPRSASDRVAEATGDGAPGYPDDAWRLMVLFLVFVITPLVVVLALWAGAAIDTWWALALVVAVHFATTAIVFAVVAFVLSGHMPRRPARRADRSAVR